MLKKILLSLLALALLCGCAAEKETVSNNDNNTTTEEHVHTEDCQHEAQGPLQNFTVVDLDGNEVTAEVFADYDLTVVNIWGTFCGPCINEMPVLGELAEEYAEKNVQFIGLVGDAIDTSGQPNEEKVAEAKEIVAQTGADYLHLVPTNELAAYLMPQISAFPTTIYVDSEGAQVGYGFAGALDEISWRNSIDEALALLEE